MRIALRAQCLIQGTLFYNVIADTTIGLYFSQGLPAYKRMKETLINAGLKEETYETSWSCFEKYINEFKNPIFQHAVYSIISHWDWYISNLGKFIYFAEGYISPNKKLDKSLLRLNSKPFVNQIEILQSQTGILIEINNDSLDSIDEMHLVRNLGLHNQWEVDETYLEKSKSKNFKVGMKRLVETPELEKWNSAFIELVLKSSSKLALLYADAPNYG
jgi:hypothetical protein